LLISFDESFALWSKNPPSEGGLNFKPLEIGIFFAVSALEIIFVQRIIYPWLVKRVSHLNHLRLGILLNIIFVVITPFER
jgi:hypothetical protein